MKIVIVGGVAGGASAAAKARRLSESAEIILFERGEQISFANCGLPYHIGGDIPERDALLVQTPEKMHDRFRIDVRVQSEVISINRKEKSVTGVDLKTGQQYQETYNKLILSPGAAPFKPGIPGIHDDKVMTLRNMSDMDRILAVLATRSQQKAAVIGGGFIGIEMAEALIQRNVETHLIELSNQVMTPIDPEMATPLHQTLNEYGVNLHLKTAVTAIQKTGDTLNLALSDSQEMAVDFVILAIGVRPETTLATAAGLELGELGGIRINDRMETSDRDILAVGDAVEIIDHVSEQPGLIPLAGPANRQGRIAAVNALGGDARYRKTQGTAVCKVFNQTVAATGMNEKALKKAGMVYDKVYVHSNNHAGYYPGACKVSMKLLFDPKGSVLGAQATGQAGVDKRIDVVAMAIQGGMTVFDLEEAELTYAPPYGSAKDVVNYAGFVAGNVLRGEFVQVHASELTDQETTVLDVRDPEEIMQTGTLPNAINIPLNSLRERLNEIPGGEPVVVYCAVGLRGYLACRILSQHGFECRNLSGGFTTWQRTKQTSNMVENNKPAEEAA
ncbi:MAG: FAD-dependent oxidoreductase [Endozoicomonas sp.]